MEHTSAAHTRDARRRRHGNSFNATRWRSEGTLELMRPATNLVNLPRICRWEIFGRAHMVRREDTRVEFHVEASVVSPAGKLTLTGLPHMEAGCARTQRQAARRKPVTLLHLRSQRHAVIKDIQRPRTLTASVQEAHYLGPPPPTTYISPHIHHGPALSTGVMRIVAGTKSTAELGVELPPQALGQPALGAATHVSLHTPRLAACTPEYEVRAPVRS